MGKRAFLAAKLKSLFGRKQKKDWVCKVCTAINSWNYTYCELCESPKNSTSQVRKYYFPLYKWVGSCGESDFIQLSAFLFYSADGQLLRANNVKNPCGSSPWKNGVRNLLTNDQSYWRDENYRSHAQSEITFYFDKPVEVHSYELIAASTNPEADPITWKLYGKKDESSEWILLDKRTNTSPPVNRNVTYGNFVFNLGLEKAKEHLEILVDSTLHLEDDQIRLFSSGELTTLWGNEERKETCKEYEPINNKIIIANKFMADTKIQQALEFIDYSISRKPLKGNFNGILLKIICKAYSCTEREAMYLTVDELCLYNSIMTIYDNFSWRQKFLHGAIQLVYENEEAGSIIQILMELARTENECKARKIKVFNQIIQRILIETSYDDRKSQDSQEGSTEENYVNLSILCDCFSDFLEDYKLQVFRSAFIEPLKFYFHVTQDKVNQELVETHAVNIFGSILLSTMGVQLPIIPYLLDEVKSCPAFLRCVSLCHYFSIITKKANIGKAWNEIEECKHEPSHYFLSIYLKHNEFILPNVSSAVLLANAAINQSRELKSYRMEVALYLDRFANFFTEDFILEPIFNVLNQERERELRQVWCRFAKLNHLSSKYNSLTDWMYEMDDKGDYKMNNDRAKEFFSFIGITKPQVRDPCELEFDI